MLPPYDVGDHVFWPVFPEFWGLGFPECGQVSAGSVYFDGAGRDVEVADYPVRRDWLAIKIIRHSAFSAAGWLDWQSTL